MATKKSTGRADARSSETSSRTSAATGKSKQSDPARATTAPSKERPLLALSKSGAEVDTFTPSMDEWTGSAENTALAMAAALTSVDSESGEKIKPYVNALRRSPMFNAAIETYRFCLGFSSKEPELSLTELCARLYLAGLCAGAMGILPMDTGDLQSRSPFRMVMGSLRGEAGADLRGGQ